MGMFLREDSAVAYLKKLLTIDEEGGSFCIESCGAITNGISGVVYFEGDICEVRQKIHMWLDRKKHEDKVDAECDHYFGKETT